MNFIQSILPSIEHFHMLGYWIAFMAALGETVIGFGLIIPGSTIVLFMGALAAKGYIDLGDLMWFAIVGAIIGDNINYFLGKRYGSKIATNGFWFVKPRHFRLGKEYFQKHGPKSLFIGRFLPSVKEFIPIVAGSFGMERKSFMFWNTLGAIGWSIAWILPGYFFAQSIDTIQVWLSRSGMIVLVIIILSISIFLIWRTVLKRGRQIAQAAMSLFQTVKQVVLSNPKVQSYVQKHEQAFTFFGKRLEKNTFFGLPFTLLFFAFLYAVLLFAGIIEDVVNSDLIVSVDVRVANLLAVFRAAPLTHIFVWITLLGKLEIVGVFMIAVIAIIFYVRLPKYLFPLAVSFFGSSAFTYLGKYIFHRPRPSVAVYPESSYSFPSGHATLAVGFYGFLAYMVIRNTKTRKHRINAAFIGLIGIFLIGFSRLYLGVHYVSDVWGGYLVGAIWLIIGIGVSEYIEANRIALVSTSKRLIHPSIVIVICILALATYAIFASQYKIPSQILPEEPQAVAVKYLSDIFHTEQSRYTETVLGSKQEPISFVIAAENDQAFISIVSEAGWTLADAVNIKSMAHIASAALLKQSYESGPMTPYFWNSQVHNFGFEKATSANNIRSRHHVRFWKTQFTTTDGLHIYVGTASLDKGIKWGVTHKIDPDIDSEREFLYQDIANTTYMKDVSKVQNIEPTIGENFSGDTFYTDGKQYQFTLTR